MALSALLAVACIKAPRASEFSTRSFPDPPSRDKGKVRWHQAHLELVLSLLLCATSCQCKRTPSFQEPPQCRDPSSLRLLSHLGKPVSAPGSSSYPGSQLPSRRVKATGHPEKCGQQHYPTPYADRDKVQLEQPCKGKKAI